MSSEYVEGIHMEAAQFLVDVAKAIAGVKSGKISYGEYYVERVIIGFDGETTNYVIRPDEGDGYELAVVSHAAR